MSAPTEKHVEAARDVYTAINGISDFQNTFIRRDVSTIAQALANAEREGRTFGNDEVREAAQREIARAREEAFRDGMKRAAEMRELVIAFVKTEIDYMRRNNLGNPEEQHNVRWARKLGITPEETAISSGEPDQ